MFEFDTSFSINTGVLSATYTGSGVHLFKDVTFSFQIIDPQENLIQSDQQFINNPLVNSINFDILDSTGGMVFANYKSGFSRTITITEIENESLFGEYTKDFGVRATVSNNINSNLFTAEFYVYGNLPVISGYSVSDGTAGYLSSPTYDEILVDIQFQNNLKYTNINRFDVYSSTGSGIVLLPSDETNPDDNPYYLYTQNNQDISQLISLSIKPVSLLYDTPYYFAVVPYSSIGSGSAIYFGPYVFSRYTSGELPQILSANQLDLFNGEESVSFDLITGEVLSDYSLIDSIESGIYSTVSYTIQLTDPSGYKTSSDLMLVINDSSTGLVERTVNNTGQFLFETGQSGLFTNLFVSGTDLSGSSFKAQRTLL